MNDISKNIIAAAIGTSVAELVVIPICTVRTNYQVNLNTNLYNCIKNVPSFYNASGLAITSQVLGISARYTIYEHLKQKNKIDNIYYDKFVNGALSGILGCVFVHPIDVLKTARQIKRPILEQYKNDGVRFLYRGYTKNIYKSILLYSTLLPIYDLCKEKYSVFTAAVATSAITTSILYPIDFIKVRHMANEKLFLGFNPLLYYRGIILSFAKNIPHFTITMYLTEKIKQNI